MTVIVVRRDDKFSQMLRDAGIEVVTLELIKPEVLDDLSEFENMISPLDSYDGVFFTSPVAAQVFVDHVEPRLKPTLYALGRRAATVLIDAGFTVRTVADANTAEELLEGFGQEEFSGKKLLFIRGKRSMRTIPDKLGHVADVDEVAVYHTIDIEPADSTRKELAGGEWACFFSPSAVEAFEKKFGTEFRIAAIGETTAARARELGFRVDVVATRATNEVFAKELIDRLKANS